jgi:hypothetical protein
VSRGGGRWLWIGTVARVLPRVQEALGCNGPRERVETKCLNIKDARRILSPSLLECLVVLSLLSGGEAVKDFGFKSLVEWGGLVLGRLGASTPLLEGP